MEDNCTASTTIKSVYNFRCVVKSGRLFRSARQDNITEEDCAILEELNLKTVLDLRSVQEYQKARGDKLLDQDREVHRVIFSNKELGDTKSQWPLETELIHKPKCGDTPRRRYIINYIGYHLIIPMLKRLSILQGFKLFLFLAVDAIFGSKYATQYFSKTLINPGGLASSYKDMLDLSGKQISTSLRLLTQPEVLPALVNCAIGKDRTGILIALVQSVLGHSDDYIADDYALSEVRIYPQLLREHWIWLQ
ncbi:triple specificity protein phosphatase PtpB-like isoform X2 [Apostichopus japonicus]|uniref:triple specificity protein phosphatase PtpB-like isoform X2 n=1 Tax=Stichopus japonicus TaxID=307972 RepID=UPI003AB2EB65